MMGTIKLDLSPTSKKITAMVIIIVPSLILLDGFYTSYFAKNHVKLFWCSDIFQWVVLPLTILYLLNKFLFIAPSMYGLDKKTGFLQTPLLDSIAIFAIGGSVFFVTQIILLNLISGNENYYSISVTFPEEWLTRLLTLSYVAVSTGFVESIFFIGLPWFYFRSVAANPSRILFVLVSSFLLAASQWEHGPHVVISTFFLQLILCAWYFKLRNLWAIATALALINLVAFA